MTETSTHSILSLPVAPQSLRNEKPTLEQLEQQGHQLKGKQDRLWLEIGNWAVDIETYYGEADYERLVVICGFDNQARMVEDWAYVCRNVPKEVQVPSILFSFHRAVAPIKDHALQLELLEFADVMCQKYKAKKGNYTVAMFREHIRTLTGKSIIEPLQPPPGNKSDTQWELEQELYQKEVDLQEERHKRRQAEETAQRYQTTIQQLQRTTAPTVRPVVERIQQLLASLSVSEFIFNPGGEYKRIRGELEAIRQALEGMG